jgi:hypothetical protein
MWLPVNHILLEAIDYEAGVTNHPRRRSGMLREG